MSSEFIVSASTASVEVDYTASAKLNGDPLHLVALRNSFNANNTSAIEEANVEHHNALRDGIYHPRDCKRKAYG